MRLRPYGDSGPLVASFDMLENYLITQGGNGNATPGSRAAR
jgi:glutamine synthetase adenylyltransferase